MKERRKRWVDYSREDRAAWDREFAGLPPLVRNDDAAVNGFIEDVIKAAHYKMTMPNTNITPPSVSS